MFSKDSANKRLEERSSAIRITEAGRTVMCKSRFICTTCSYEWVSNFNKIWSGRRCVNCAGFKKLTAEECQERLKGRSIKLLKYGGNTNKKADFKCLVCEHEWTTFFINVDRRGTGCPKCANFLTPTEEECREQLKGLKVKLIKYVGTVSGKSTFKCGKCKCNYKARMSDVRRSSGVCSSCTKYGFDPKKPAWLYVVLLDTPNGLCYGFGITNDIKGRMQKHKRNLKHLLKETFPPVYFEKGSEAKKVETVWRKSTHKVRLDVEGFKTECVIANQETTVMIFK